MASSNYDRKTFHQRWFKTMSDLLHDENQTKMMFDAIDYHYRNNVTAKTVIKKNEESPVFFIMGRNGGESQIKVKEFIAQLKDIFGMKLLDSTVSDIDETKLESNSPFPSIMYLTLRGFNDFHKAKRISNKYRQSMIIQYTEDQYSADKDNEGYVTQFKYSPQGVYFLDKNNFDQMWPFLFGGGKK